MSDYEFITIAEKEPDPVINWPVSGKKYTIEISVDHCGPHYDDEWTNVENAPDEINDLLSFGGLTFDEMVEDEDLPLASGYYEVVVEYLHEKMIDWESGYDEGGDYLIVHSCKRLRNLELDLIGL